MTTLTVIFLSVIFSSTAVALDNFTSVCHPSGQLTEVIDLDQHGHGFFLLDHLNYSANNRNSSAFECSWLLKFPDNQRERLPIDEQKVVVLEFPQFDLIPSGEANATDNCLQNFVQIWSLKNYSTGDLRAVHCGSGRVPDFYGSLQRSVLVKLKIGDSIKEPKFKVYFTTKFVGSVPSGKEIDATASDDEFLCPPSTHFVCLFNGIPRCRLNSCWCDSVSNCDDMIDELDCTNDMQLFKHSEYHDESAVATKKQTESGCGSARIQSGSQGSVHSKNYPCDYPADLSCVWEITAPPGSHLVIAFNSIFSISQESEADGKCPNDRLTFFYAEGDKKKALGIYCGYTKPTSKLIKTNKITVNFETSPRSSSNNGTGRILHGFRLHWKAKSSIIRNKTLATTSKPDLLAAACSIVDGLVLTSLQGLILSPSYGVSHYPASTVCLWRIAPSVSLSAGEMYSISLEFVYFEVHGGPKCEQGDWLEASSIDLQQNRRRGRYCSSNRPPRNGETLNAKTTKPVQLKFFSDSDGEQDYGFQIWYEVKIVKQKKTDDSIKAGELIDNDSPTPSARLEVNSCGVTSVPVAKSLFFQSKDENDDDNANIAEITRIVGGSIANPANWPWIVQLSFKGNHTCAATVISKGWLLTAAHCFIGRYRIASGWTATIGKASLDAETAWDNDQSPLIDARIKNILVHRQFMKQKMSKEFDIALIQLQEPLSFNNRLVKPICLPSRDTQLDDQCFVAGWGRTQGTGGERKLKDLKIPIISLEKCRKMTKQHWAYVMDSMFCGGYVAGGADSCQGDSGGPLACRVGNRWELHGIVSFGVKCALPNSPGVYTRVYNYTTWINNVMSKFA